MQALHRAWRPRTSSLLFLSFFTVLSFSLLLGDCLRAGVDPFFTQRGPSGFRAGVDP